LQGMIKKRIHSSRVLRLASGLGSEVGFCENQPQFMAQQAVVNHTVRRITQRVLSDAWGLNIPGAQKILRERGP